MAIANKNVKTNADVSLAKIDITQTPRSTHLYLQLPEVATASLQAAAAANEGGVVYDATTNTVKFSDGSSWGNISATGSAETLQNTYVAGQSINITAAVGDLDITYDVAGSRVDLDVDSAVTVTDMMIFRTSDAAGLATDALDISDGGITNAVNIGGNNIVGTALDLDGNNGAILVQSIDRFNAGALSIGGSTATSVTITPVTTIAGALTASAAATFSSSITQSGGNVSLTGSATTGDAILLDGSTVTTGNVLRIEYDAANSGAGFGALEVTEDAVAVFTVGEDGNTVIAGSATGTVALTLTAGDLTVTDGGLNVTQTSGDAIDVIPPAAGAVIDANLPASYNLAGGAIDIDGSTGSGPVVEIAMSGAYTGDYLSLNMTNAVGAKAVDITGAGTRTAALIHVTDTPGSAAPSFNLDITPEGAQATANVFDIDIAGTGTASIIDIDFSAAYAGDALDVDMTNAVGASAFVLTGAGTRTVPLITITDVPTTSAPSIDLNITPGAGVQSGIDIDVAGTQAADVVAIDFSAAFTGDALNITTTNMGAGGQAIVVDGSIANSGAIVNLSTSGISTAAGSVLSCSTSTQPGAANTGLCARFLDTGAAQATSYAVQIDSTNNEALTVSVGKAHFVEAATFLASNKVAVDANYVQAAGSANAITVAANADDTGTAIPLADGLRLVVDLNSRTLQAGANTFDYISGGAVSIVSHYNVASNIGTAYAANGFIELMYNSTSSVWMDMSQ